MTVSLAAARATTARLEQVRSQATLHSDPETTVSLSQEHEGPEHRESNAARMSNYSVPTRASDAAAAPASAVAVKPILRNSVAALKVEQDETNGLNLSDGGLEQTARSLRDRNHIAF